MSDKIPGDLPDWIQGHLRQYLATDGADGHMWDSSAAGGPGLIPTLLLTTTGRRSGSVKTLPLIYGKTGTDYVIVASKGGRPKHPAWYLNLVAAPDVNIQVATERFRTRARTTAGVERETLWAQMVEIYPPFVDYQAKTDRVIPVVVLERIAD